MAVDTRPQPVVTETPPKPPRPNYAAWVVGGLMVVFGILWLLDIAGVLTLRASLVLPTILAVVGVALILGARDGPHTGLVVVGVFLTLAVIAIATTPPEAFSGGVGERSFVVRAPDELAARYELGVGDLRLDLRDLTLAESAEVEVAVGAGEMVVVVPDDIPVSVDASVGAGEIELFGEAVDGLSVVKSYVSPGFDEADVTLTLDLDVAAGRIEVRR